jgi:MFS family permease
MVGSIITVLPLGKIYAKYNAKWLYLISVVFFLAASALCGASPNMSAMIVGRVLLGMAGNGIYFGIMTLLSVNTSDKERPSYLSLVGFVWGIGTVLGPVIGGAFAKFDWRWGFYINLIICGVFAPVYIFLLPTFQPQPGVPLSEKARHFDYLGAIFSTGAIMCLVLAVNFGGALYSWNSGSIIALFVVSGILFIIFGLQQAKSILTTPSERMFPVEVMRKAEACLLFIASAGANATGFIPIYYIPLYFQFTRGDSPLDAAVRLLPLITILSATIILNGYLMSKLGYYQPWYVIAGALSVVGNVLLSQVTADTPVANIYGYEVLVAIGSGAVIQAGYATIQTVITPEETSAGIAFMMLAQFSGIVFGLSVSGAIFVNEGFKALTAALPQVSADELRAVLSGKFFFPLFQNPSSSLPLKPRLTFSRNFIWRASATFTQ